MRLARSSAGVRSRYPRLRMTPSPRGVGPRRQHVRGALDAAIREDDADDVDGDADALQPEPGVLSGRDRREIEVRPHRVDGEIAGIAEHELGKDPARAQRRSEALATRDRRRHAVPRQGDIPQADDGHAQAAELRYVGWQRPRTAEPQRDV